MVVVLLQTELSGHTIADRETINRKSFLTNSLASSVEMRRLKSVEDASTDMGQLRRKAE
jgi:hypothetical protein